MLNKYTKSFSDVFKIYLEIFPRQAVYVYEVKIKRISNTFDSLVVI